MVKEAMLWDITRNNMVKCSLCAHNCVIGEGKFGFCGMRENIAGKLFTHAYGEVIAHNVDPIEKKPLYHFIPGTTSYSIATIGCNFKCSFCQNWRISQPSANAGELEGIKLDPDEVVEAALKNGCGSISYTYTEPTVFFEYAYDIARRAKASGLANIFVTNGYMSKDAIDIISPYLDAANVDLKFFSDKAYNKICAGHLQPVLDSIEYMASKGIWLEVTTLVVPRENDDEDSLRGIARFISGVNNEIPWHISRFHPDYKVTDKHATMVETLLRAKEIAVEEGLKHVYMGNVGGANETLCPECGKTLLERGAFTGRFTDKDASMGKCSECGTSLSGVWSQSKKEKL